MQRHQKLIEQIQRKMAQPSKFKSYEEKKEKLFEYDMNDSQFSREESNNNQPNKLASILSKTQAEKALQEIYNFYLNSYIQPRKHYQTFDVVNERKLTFQPFILFMKNFKLLKTIYPLQKIKLYFKKHADYGKFLTFQNFIFMLNELSHEPVARNFFNPNTLQQIDIETADQFDRQQLYTYMNLNDPPKYRKNFNPLFEPFNCNDKPEAHKINYSYRKFSLPELRKKAIPDSKNKPEEKELFVMKNKEIVNDNPFEKAKSIVVSWQSLRSKSVATLQENSTDLIKKKYVRQDVEDDVYLSEYNPKQRAMREKINQKIRQLSQVQKVKNKAILDRIQEKSKKNIIRVK